jgi:hypothetical protein
LLAKLSAALQLSEIEEEALFDSAHKSKRYLRLPEGIIVEGYEYAHQFVNLLSDLQSDRSLRIIKFITKKSGYLRKSLVIICKYELAAENFRW